MNQAILDYLNSSGFEDSFEAFRKEANVDIDPKKNGLLEKKWASILRLQKKIMELETKVTQYEEEIKEKKSGKEKSKETLPRGPPRHILKGHRDAINSLVSHPEFDVVCSASEDAMIRVWDYEEGVFQQTLKGHTGAVRDLDFEPKGKMLASCSNDLTIKLWDFSTYTCVKTLHGHEHTVSCVKFTPNGDFLISSSRDKTIKIWETATGYCVKTIEAHDKWVRKIAVSEDGSLLLSCSSDQTVKAWDIKTGKNISVMRDHSNAVECIAFAPMTANKFLEDSMNGKDLHEKEKMLKEAANKPQDDKNNKPGLYYASGSRDKVIKICETATGRCITTLVGHDNWVRGLAFHPSGRYLFSCSDDRSIRVWDLQELRQIRLIPDAHTHFIQCIEFSKRNPHLVTGGVDNTIHVWPCR